MSDRRLPLSTVLVASLLAIAIGALAAGLIFGGGDDSGGDVAELDPDFTQPTLGEPAQGTLGDAAPTDPYQTFDGTEASVADYRGTPLVVNFWASWCVPCVAEMPAFEEVHQELGDEVAFLGLSVRDGEDQGRERIDQTGITYDVGRDPSGSLIAQFGGVAMPTTALVDEDGTIVRILSGETSADELRDAIAEAFPDMIDAPFALALAAGMVATVNPCGFAMLPAYLSYFLGTEADEPDTQAGVLRALAVGGVVTLGFVAVFAVVGAAVSHLRLQIYEYLPWVTGLMGVFLVVLGVAMLRGFELTLRLPKLDRGGTTRGLTSMFVFGVSYAVASLSCTLPTFLGVFAASLLGQASFVTGVSVFVTYALGMGLVLTALTVALALARHSIVHHMRRAVPYVQRVSGILLIVAGAYLVWYARYARRVFDGDTSNPGPVAWVEGISADFSSWVQDTGATRVAMGLALFLCVALLVAVLRPRARS